MGSFNYLLLCLCFYAGITLVNADMSIQSFTRQSRPNVKMLQQHLVLSPSTKLECSFECTRRPETCLSFVYDKHNKSCLLGSWVVPDATATTPNQLYQYSTGSFCNTTANFSIVTNGNVSVCMWFSPYTANWTSARTDCQAIGAQLYTVKSQEKYNILIELLKDTTIYVWLGLNDLEIEGTFVWEDGTVLDDAWTKAIFAPGRPDNYEGLQDCAMYYYLHGLDDDRCEYEYRVLCEINQHGF